MESAWARWLRRHLLVAAAAFGLATPAGAVELAWSGFATLGHARSNSEHTYQRFIDRNGTFDRDSVLAGQLDGSFSPRLAATLQLRLAPAPDHESRWQAHTAWAFVSWRPDDRWQLRLGRMRTPLYLHSESIDVGVSHDMARLPYEAYSISPSNEFDGLSATRTFDALGREWSVDAYAGATRPAFRVWTRDGLPPEVPAGSNYRALSIHAGGLVLTARDERATWRLGLHAARTRDTRTAWPVRYPRVDLAPGIGYWQVDGALPGPGVPAVPRVRNLILTAAADVDLGGGWRTTTELLRLRQYDTELGSAYIAGYAALFKRIDNFTPYVSVSRQLSDRSMRRWRSKLLGATLPSAIPGADAIVAAQRLAGEFIPAHDQSSLALGASYALSPRAKIKAEWMRTRIGSMSAHFDTPPGQPALRRANVDTLTVNFSVAF